MTIKSFPLLQVVPGWVRTEMGSQNAPDPPEMGQYSAIHILYHHQLNSPYPRRSCFVSVCHSTATRKVTLPREDDKQRERFP